MTRLNDTQRKHVIETLKCHESVFASSDFSPLFSTGVTVSDIGIITHAMTLLQEAPFLEEPDFIHHGFSSRQIEFTLGGLDNFKQLLGIRDYCFHDWLAQNSDSSSNQVTIPYWVYQRFSDDIRRDFMRDLILHPSLNVELNAKVKIGYISLFERYKAIIPSDDSEAAQIAAMMMADRHQFLSYDEETSELTLKSLKTRRDFSIEVRCLSSTLNRPTPHAVCVVDDASPTKPTLVKRRIISFSDLMLHC
ncbi:MULTISPECIES: hypothetical protein [unclassified Vibrio]|jgi:hypothetical protein|uniref:hypothetical protein n=1 Tax=unclassified Vibrio TaxID=2614977 RepID=UPI00354D8124